MMEIPTLGYQPTLLTWLVGKFLGYVFTRQQDLDDACNGIQIKGDNIEFQVGVGAVGWLPGQRKALDH